MFPVGVLLPQKTIHIDMTATHNSLIRDLKALGLSEGDMLFIHSSFKSLGDVDGGAGTVVGALRDVVGQAGLVLMPSFNLLDGYDLRAKMWDIEKTPSTVGWLTEYFRQMPETYRSDHYSHSVAAQGHDAEAFVADHLHDDGLASPWDRAPWGKTYGSGSPMVRAYEQGGKILMVGVDYHTSTYVHLVEVMYWNERLQKDERAGFIGLERTKMGAFWDAVGCLHRGKVGQAVCRCFAIRDYVDTLLAEVKKNPDQYDRVKLRALDQN